MTKKENHRIDVRKTRAKEKLALRKGLESNRSIMMGRIARRAYGGCVIESGC